MGGRRCISISGLVGVDDAALVVVCLLVLVLNWVSAAIGRMGGRGGCNGGGWVRVQWFVCG